MCIDLLAWKEASYLTDAYSAHNMYTLNLAFEASKDVQSVEEKSTESTLADDLNFLILKVLGPKPCACTAWPTRPSSRICKLPGQALEPLQPQFKSGVAGESIHEGICAVGVQVLKRHGQEMTRANWRKSLQVGELASSKIKEQTVQGAKAAASSARRSCTSGNTEWYAWNLYDFTKQWTK